VHQRENPHLGLDGFSEGGAKTRTCDHPDCAEEGRFRAPRSRHRLRDYFWFCLDHVRAYNAAWNYFADMSEAEIDHYRHSQASWHRPTWPLNGKGNGKSHSHGFADLHMCDPLDIFANLDSPGQRYSEHAFTGAGDKPVTAKERTALSRLGLDESATRDDIKRAYKHLVKRYHPDVNGGDRAAEDKFKIVAEAYRHLSEHWQSA
jgi:hypothetical protein